MKKASKYILAGVMIIGGLGFWWWNEKTKREAELEALKRKYQNRNPPHNSDDWRSWIQLIISIYGEVNELWEEGGVFYGTNVPRPGSDKLDEILGKFKGL